MTMPHESSATFRGHQNIGIHPEERGYGMHDYLSLIWLVDLSAIVEVIFLGYLQIARTSRAMDEDFLPAVLPVFVLYSMYTVKSTFVR